MTPEIRPPAVAGSFYEDRPTSLRRQIEGCFRHALGPQEVPKVDPRGPRKILGLVSPHAGYAYSGPVAAHGFAQLAGDGKPQVVIILGPNHRSLGSPVAISSKGHWQTPLGRISLDGDLARSICAAVPFVREDELAHRMEHSLEVQLPFLQYLFGEGFRLVPIAIGFQDLTISLELGRALALVSKGKDAVIIASTDFTHYETQSTAEQQDQGALESILRLSPEELAAVIGAHRISMCGPGPVMAMLAACREIGASKAELLKYATSGDTSGNYHQVVGYASVKVERE